MTASILQWLVHQFRVRRRPIVTVAGVKIRLGRHMSPQVERTVSRGRYEQDEFRLIEQVLSPGDVVLEVGAGLGLVSAYCAKRLGSSRVFAYEANPDLEACIRETYSLNEVQPTLEMCAVGADAGKVTLFRSEDLWASSVLRPSGKVRPVEVPVKALSEIVQLVRATLLIVDVEGAESELFDRAHLPTVSRIILELHERVIGTAGARRVRSTLDRRRRRSRQSSRLPERVSRVSANRPNRPCEGERVRQRDRGAGGPWTGRACHVGLQLAHLESAESPRVEPAA